MKRHFKDISWASVFEWIMVVAFILVLTCSCTCQQRMARLQRRCPECFQADTLHLRDTVIHPGLDIVERLPIPLDDGLTPQVQVVQQPDYTLTLNWTADSVFVGVEVPPDTVYLDRDVPVVHPLPPCPRQRSTAWVPWALIGSLAIGYHIGRRVRSGV